MIKGKRRWNAPEILELMKRNASEENRLGMARYGIKVDNAYGVRVDWIRSLAKDIGKDHELAMRLWESGVHEARILASMVADPEQTDNELMERWVLDLGSWDMCDQCCSNLFIHVNGVKDIVPKWCSRSEEFVKRAGFVLIAQVAVKEKKATPNSFLPYLDLIEKGSNDSRNNVKKAVNWALRQIGKRNMQCHELAMPVAERLALSEDRTARWIGKDAVRELRSEAVLSRLQARAMSL